MSEVFEGVHRASGRPVVLKTWAARRAPGAVSTFLREARAAARLHHPGIVRVRDFGVWSGDRTLHGVPIPDGAPWVVMDRVVGRDLRHAPVRGERAVCDLARAALDALAHAHARGVIHRDIKPANVVVDARGAPVLIDFGLAELANDAERATGGTPLYLAPEQVEHDAGFGQGPWTDVYALGCVAHELLTGQPPFLGADVDALHAAKSLGRQPGALERAAAPGLVAWIDRALAPQPEDRFVSAAHAAHALDLAMHAPSASAAARELSLTSAPARRASLDASSMLWAPRVAAPSPTSAPAPAPDTPRARRAVIPRGGRWDDGAPDAGPAALAGAEVGIYAWRTAPCVGRAPERAAMWRLLGGGGRRGVELVGEAGVGKTRLSEWFTRRAHARYGVQVVRVRFEPSGADALAWARGLEAALGVSGLSGPDRGTRLARRLRAWGVAAPLERALVASVVEEDALRSWSPEALARALEVLARALGDDLVVALEDAHLSASAPEVWAACGPGADLIWVATTRRAGALGDEAARIDLGPLDDASMRAMMAATLDLRPEVVAHVLERAQGNPMYATQLVLDLVQQQALEPGPDGFGWAEGVAPPVPRKILELCAARLDALSAPTRDALELAAFLGASLRPVEWGAVLARTSPEPAALEQAFALGLLAQEDAGVRFEHGMWREGLTHRAEQEGRAPALRAQCVAILEREGADRIDSHLRVFHHALALGLLDRAFTAFDYVANWQPTGEAVGTFALLEQAVGPDPGGHFGFRLALAQLTLRIGKLAMSDLDALFARADALRPELDPAHAVELGAQLEHHRAYRLYTEWSLSAALEVAGRVFVDGVSDATRHSAHRLVAEVSSQLGDFAAARHHIEAARRTAPKTQWSQGWLLYSEMFLADEEGDLDEVERLCDAASACFEESYDLAGMATVLHQRGLLAVQRAEHDAAASWFEQALELYELSGDGGYAITLEELARVEAMGRGRHDRAAELLARIARAQERGESLDLSIEDLRALLAARAGDWEAASRELTALAAAHDAFAQPAMLDTLDRVAALAARAGRPRVEALCARARAAVESRLGHGHGARDERT
jgi:tetratricopeptide (TPR) repeat protein